MRANRDLRDNVMLTDRAYYEEQGRRALEEGAAFHCSEATTNEAVLGMARSSLADINDILDLGCGANLVYDSFLAEMGKRLVCMDFALTFSAWRPRTGARRWFRVMLPRCPSVMRLSTA